MVPLKESSLPISEVLNEASRSMAGGVVMIKVVAVVEAPLIGLVQMVVLAIGPLKTLIQPNLIQLLTSFKLKLERGP